jgi:hypothetical protein
VCTTARGARADALDADVSSPLSSLSSSLSTTPLSLSSSSLSTVLSMTALVTVLQRCAHHTHHITSHQTLSLTHTPSLPAQHPAHARARHRRRRRSLQNVTSTHSLHTEQYNYLRTHTPYPPHSPRLVSTRLCLRARRRSSSVSSLSDACTGTPAWSVSVHNTQRAHTLFRFEYVIVVVVIVDVV